MIRIPPWLVAALLGLATPVAVASKDTRPPIADSRCPVMPLVDDGFRDAALAALESLVIRADGKAADGAIRSDHSPGLRDASGRAWFRITAYQANFGMIGALATGRRELPLAARWLRWQVRHIALSGSARGVVLDTWVDAATLEESSCPAGLDANLCDDVDAFDSTAASTLLMADAYVRRGGEPMLLREPAVRAGLEAAAGAMATLVGSEGFTIAKPGHPAIYAMDQVEVAAGWRAWSRIQRDVYAQPASADNSLALAGDLERSIRSRLATRNGWRVSLDVGSPRPAVWYPDTVAQAWPLLWLPERPGAPDPSRSVWTRAIAGWQRDTAHEWSASRVDPDGFWWPAIAVAATCSGDNARAARWIARARTDWLDPRKPFARPFQVGDLLWLLWMAEPVVDDSPP